MRIDFIYGTRPELIKLAMPIRAFKADERFAVRVLSTGQHKEMLYPLEEWFEIEPDVRFNSMRQNQGLEELTSRLLLSFHEYYRSNELPDVMVVQGDTTTAFVGGLSGFYKRIRVAHVEAGLRTHNMRSPWPEEMNRVLLSRLVDVHFAPTELNRFNLLKEGIPGSAIHITGNTVIDALLYSKEKVEAMNSYPESLAEFFTGPNVTKRIVLITGHRRENFGEGFASICAAIRELADQHPEVYFIYPVHLNPNVQQPVNELLGKSLQRNVRLTEPLNYPEFVSLMQRCYLVLTDSGGVQEEAPSLGKPVLVMRDTTERPEGIDAGCVRLTGTNKQSIISSVSRLLTNDKEYKSMANAANPYGDGRAAEYIANVISTYE